MFEYWTLMLLPVSSLFSPWEKRSVSMLSCSLFHCLSQWIFSPEFEKLRLGKLLMETALCNTLPVLSRVLLQVTYVDKRLAIFQVTPMCSFSVRDDLKHHHSWLVNVCYLHGPLFTKKTQSYWCKNHHYKPKTVWQLSETFNGNPYTNGRAYCICRLGSGCADRISQCSLIACPDWVRMFRGCVRMREAIEEHQNILSAYLDSRSAQPNMSSQKEGVCLENRGLGKSGLGLGFTFLVQVMTWPSRIKSQKNWNKICHFVSASMS